MKPSTALSSCLLGLLCAFFSGCTLIGGKGFTPPVLEHFDDAAVQSYAKTLMKNWGTRATKAHMLDVGGNVVLSSAASAISIASAAGGRPATLSLVGSIFASVGQALGIVDPPNVANAYSAGFLIIAEGQEGYADCISKEGAPAIVDKKMSPCGAQFLKGINDALHTVNNLILGMPPDKDVMARLAAVTQKAQADAIAEAAAQAAAKTAKLVNQQKETTNATTNSALPPGTTVTPPQQ